MEQAREQGIAVKKEKPKDLEDAYGKACDNAYYDSSTTESTDSEEEQLEPKRGKWKKPTRWEGREEGKPKQEGKAQKKEEKSRPVTRSEMDELTTRFQNIVLLAVGAKPTGPRETGPNTNCYNCQQPGHIAKFCRNATVCPKCGGNHRIGHCEQKAGAPQIQRDVRLVEALVDPIGGEVLAVEKRAANATREDRAAKRRAARGDDEVEIRPRVGISREGPMEVQPPQEERIQLGPQAQPQPEGPRQEVAQTVVDKRTLTAATLLNSTNILCTLGQVLDAAPSLRTAQCRWKCLRYRLQG